MSGAERCLPRAGPVRPGTSEYAAARLLVVVHQLDVSSPQSLWPRHSWTSGCSDCATVACVRCAPRGRLHDSRPCPSELTPSEYVFVRAGRFAPFMWEELIPLPCHAFAGCRCRDAHGRQVGGCRARTSQGQVRKHGGDCGGTRPTAAAESTRRRPCQRRRCPRRLTQAGSCRSRRRTRSDEQRPQEHAQRRRWWVRVQACCAWRVAQAVVCWALVFPYTCCAVVGKRGLAFQSSGVGGWEDELLTQVVYRGHLTCTDSTRPATSDICVGVVSRCGVPLHPQVPLPRHPHVPVT